MKTSSDIFLKMELGHPAVAVGAILDSRLSLLPFDVVYPNVGDVADGKECGA